MKKSSYRYVHTFYRAMQLFFKKHYSHYSLIVSLPINIAIWTRALLAYVGNQFVHRKVTQETPSINCIVLGSKQAIEEAGSILQEKLKNGRHTFIEAGEETMPLGHTTGNIDLEGYNTVVYDTEAYTYDTILKLLNSSTRKLRLGTYSTKTKKLITEELVLDYGNSVSKR